MMIIIMSSQGNMSGIIYALKMLSVKFGLIRFVSHSVLYLRNKARVVAVESAAQVYLIRYVI